MRLTKDVKEVLITNLLKQSPLGLRAIACLEERRDIVKTVRLLCLAAEKTSDLAIRDFRNKIENLSEVLGNKFMDARVAAVEVVETKYHSLELSFAIGGEQHIRHIDGHDREYVNGHGSSYLWETPFFGRWLRSDYPFEGTGYFIPYTQVLLPADPALQERITHNATEYSKLFDEVLAWRATMRANLAAVNTSEKLREVWPEAFPFLPPEAKKETAVALSPETLNALCGLPK